MKRSSQAQPELSSSRASQALNHFVRKVGPAFTVRACAGSMLLTLRHFLPPMPSYGFVWPPHHRPDRRIRLTLKGPSIQANEEDYPEFQIQKGAASVSDDFRLTLHRSLKSLPAHDAWARQSFAEQGLRSAVEMQLHYYGRPLCWVILGLQNPRAIHVDDLEGFLLLFGRCSLVSLQGAYLAETEGRDLTHPADRPSLTLQWFLSVVRHLQLSMMHLDNARPDDAQEALERASTVASVCLAQMLSLVSDTRAQDAPHQSSIGVSPDLDG
ncbi:MAG TPA: hypothetical protein VGD78_10300 [Chthoniobacterales bacterium]